MLNTTDKIIKHKTGLLNLAEELCNVSKACQVMGYSRDTFYRYKSAVDEGGVEALFERTRRKPNRANRVDEAVEQAVIMSATDFPAYGQARTSNELRKLGVFVSPSGVRSIWLRHDLANFKARLKALEVKVASEYLDRLPATLCQLEYTRCGLNPQPKVQCDGTEGPTAFGPESFSLEASKPDCRKPVGIISMTGAILDQVVLKPRRPARRT